MELNDNDMDNYKRIRKLTIINTILLLPCTYLTVFNFVNTDTSIQNSIWTRGFLGLTLPIVFLRIFYLPYITSTILSIAYFSFLKKSKFPKKETLFFAILFIITILGLLSLETVFDASMSV